MNGQDFTLAGATLEARLSGALWQAEGRVLTVSDLHLGKSDRIARRSGAMLPPYENIETLTRLGDEIEALNPAVVICLGDSFDDLSGTDALDEKCRALIARLQAGRDWVWIEGNHDPGPVDLGGSHRTEARIGGLTYRHIAQADAEPGEISGHYHPKLALPGGGAARKCFVFDARRCILPAFGAYTGGLHAQTPVLRSLFSPRSFAVLLGRRPVLAPLPAARAETTNRRR